MGQAVALAPRDEAPFETDLAPARKIEMLPRHRVQVRRPLPAEHARDARHGLPLKHGHSVTLVRVLPSEVADELLVRQHRAFLLRLLGRRR